MTEIINLIRTNIASTVPQNLTEAFESENKKKWLDVVLEEFEAMNKNSTWTIIDKSELPAQANIIDSRWVLKEKEEANGMIRFRAHLAARGFKDKNEYDQTEKKGPSIKLN